MPWGDGTGVPTSGTALVIVGTDGDNRVHVRIFDQDGRRVADTDETKLPPAQARPISVLKRRVRGLLPPHVMTVLERARIIGAVASIVHQYPLRDVKIWELDSGREVVSFPMAASLERSSLWLGFSPDGGALATVATNPAGDVLQVWDITTRRPRFAIPLQSLSQSTQVPLQAAFSPDGRRIACALNLLQVGVWDAADGKPVAYYPGFGTTVAFSRDGRNLLAAGLFGAVKVWDVADDPSARILNGEGPVIGPAVSPDARRIACIVKTSGSPPVVKVWDPAGRQLVSLPKRSTAPSEAYPTIDSVVWSAGGDRLAYVTNPYALMIRNDSRRQEKAAGGLTVWDLDGKELFNLDEEGIAFLNPAFSPDGTRVAAVRRRRSAEGGGEGREQSEARVWDIATGRALITIPDCTVMTFDPDGKRLAGVAYLIRGVGAGSPVGCRHGGGARPPGDARRVFGVCGASLSVRTAGRSRPRSAAGTSSSRSGTSVSSWYGTRRRARSGNWATPIRASCSAPTGPGLRPP